MKLLLTILFFLSAYTSVYSCLCAPGSFCTEYEQRIEEETTVVFMGSYLSEEMLGSSGDKAIKFKAEKIYNGKIVTPTSIHYRGEPYVNTDSTIWLRTGSESFCGRPFDSTRAIYIVDYNSLSLIHI